MTPSSKEIDVRSIIELLSKKVEKNTSKDAIDLVQRVIENLRLYNVLLELALSDGIITEDEQSRLRGFRKEIIEHSQRIIEEDNIVTKEELEMFKLINSLIYKENLIDFEEKESKN